MAATFSNPRLAAEPCELMRGCSFAENFVTLTTMANNNGTSNGSGTTADHGATFTGSGDFSYDDVQIDGVFSVIVRFSTSTTATGNDYMFASENIHSPIGGGGFAVWVDADGVKASMSDGVGLDDVLEVDLDYADGVTHTATYAVDMDGGTHSLFVDALTADTGSCATTGPIGQEIVVAGHGSGDRFTGTIYKVRLFDQLLVELEHDLYHADTLTSWFKTAPTVKCKCDEFGDDDGGGFIWDATSNLNDLNKGDNVTASLFPTFVTDKYSFDMVDDYIDGWPTWPAAFTVNAALSTPYLPFPAVTQENDNTLTDQLDTSGTYFGYLHNLTIFASALTQIQLYHAEYRHLYWLSRGRAVGAYHRLITEDTCKMALFMDGDRGIYSNLAPLQDAGIATLVTRGSPAANGCTFASATSNVEFAHNAAYNSDELTLAVYGTFAGSEAAGTLIDKGTDYKLLTNGNQIDFNGSTIAHTFDNNEQIAVTHKNGFKPRFGVDGEYIGEGSIVITRIPDSTNVTIGNDNAYGSATAYALKQVYIGDKALSDREVKALYEEAQSIGATIMETGQRVAVPKDSISGANPVDYDVDPGDDFQLIDVVMEWDAAPTTPGDITIFTIRDSVKCIEARYDPSLSTKKQHKFRFDLRVANGQTYGVDYANADGDAIDTFSTYQTDPSVS